MKDDFFEKLDQELNALELPMSEKLKATPIQASPEISAFKEESPVLHSTPRPDFFTWLKRRKTWVTAVACGLVAVFIGGVSLSLLPTPEDESGYSSYLYLDINPSVAVVLNKDGKVEKLVSRNEDGDNLLQDSAFKRSIVGLDGTQAVKLLSERAAKMGYLDLLSDGSNGTFNEINVSVFGDSALSQERLTAIQNSITEYFCEHGVFVYVDVTQTVLEDFKTSVETFVSRPETYLDYIVTQESQTKTYETFFFEYTEDLLRETLAKYDLYVELSELATAIEADTGTSYWLSTSETNDANAMTVLLEKFYHLYGEDFKKTDSFSDNFLVNQEFAILESVYSSQAENAEELRLLLQSGITSENFSISEFAKFSLFSSVLGYGEALFESLELLFGMISENATNFVVALNAFGETYANDLYARHEKFFDAVSQENTIDSTAYHAFLERIGKGN